jgi:uncharacterized protein Yka (UPF0111/DUF47 family)
LASRTKKKEDVFYGAFKKFSSKLVDGAELFQDLVHSYPEDSQKKIEAINDFEHECDKLVHDILFTLNDAFITPFDREEVDLITRLLDDVADGINCAAKQFKIYDVHSVLPESTVLADLTLEAAKVLEDIFEDLPKMKKKKKDILEGVIEVNRIENVGDDTYEKALYNLFRAETDALHLVKWVRILDHMEDTIDSCETIANLVERVVSKNT